MWLNPITFSNIFRVLVVEPAISSRIFKDFDWFSTLEAYIFSQTLITSQDFHGPWNPENNCEQFKYNKIKKWTVTNASGFGKLSKHEGNSISSATKPVLVKYIKVFAWYTGQRTVHNVKQMAPINKENALQLYLLNSGKNGCLVHCMFVHTTLPFGPGIYFVIFFHVENYLLVYIYTFRPRNSHSFKSFRWSVWLQTHKDN